MPHRGDVFAPDQYYHIYNRAVDGGLLVFSPDNHAYCLRLAKRYRARDGTTVIAYCCNASDGIGETPPLS